jgi:hypothetical protein
MRRLVILLFVAAGCGGGLSRDDFWRIIADAAVCSSGDTCVVVDTCLCPVMVDAARVEEVQTAARKVDCGGGPRPLCPVPTSTAQCENGTCVGVYPSLRRDAGPSHSQRSRESPL